MLLLIYTYLLTYLQTASEMAQTRQGTAAGGPHSGDWLLL